MVIVFGVFLRPAAIFSLVALTAVNFKIGFFLMTCPPNPLIMYFALGSSVLPGSLCFFLVDNIF